MDTSDPIPPAIVLTFADSFDETIGLWRQSRPGHTRPVAELSVTHSGREAASRLFSLAYWRSLDPERGTKILRALRNLQCLDRSSQHGGFRWYYEEPQIVDTNAAFFIGLNLIALDRAASASLNDEGREILAAIFRDLNIWFNHEAETKAAHYPNKFMGDLVCAWLIQENIDPHSPSAKRLLEVMRETADYWQTQHWGWGEHLSDTYANVLLNQLSALLLFSRHLPKEVWERYRSLLNELLEIEDQFADGPRVPVIRTYAGDGRGNHHSYRSEINLWTEAETQKGKIFPFGDLFTRLGWERIADPLAPPRERAEIPCFGGAIARAWVTPTARLGTLSHFPIMPGTDHQGWGLSWQSMPVAFATGKNGWGYLRWHAREDGVDRHHPALNQKAGFLANALSQKLTPPIVGRTDSLQEGPDALVVRRMPALAPTWEIIADQLVLTGGVWETAERDSGAGWTRLVLQAEGEVATVFYLPFSGPKSLKAESSDQFTTWSAEYAPAELKESLTAVWIFCWGRRVETPAPPQPQADGSWEIFWPVAAGDRRVIYAPAQATPLRVE